jgi:hypothetical protein
VVILVHIIFLTTVHDTPTKGTLSSASFCIMIFLHSVYLPILAYNYCICCHAAYLVLIIGHYQCLCPSLPAVYAVKHKCELPIRWSQTSVFVLTFNAIIRRMWLTKRSPEYSGGVSYLL